MKIKKTLVILILISTIFLSGCRIFDGSFEVDGYTLINKNDKYYIKELPKDLNTTYYEIPAKIGKYDIYGFGVWIKGIMSTNPSLSIDYRFRCLVIPEEIKEINGYVSCGFIKTKNKLSSYEGNHCLNASFIMGEKDDKLSNAEYITDDDIYEDFIYEIINDEAVIKYGMGSVDSVIPNEINGYPVTKISDYAFENFTLLETVKLNENLKEIGEYGFGYCARLTEINFPENLEKINNRAFYQCSSLENVTILSSVKSLGKLAFAQCKNLKSVNISKEIGEIPSQAFYACPKLKNVTIEEGITGIGFYAFAQTALEEISIPQSVSSISEGAFEQCILLEELILPKNLIDLEPIIDYCSNIKRIVINGNINNFNLINEYTSLKNLEEIVLNNCETLVLDNGVLYSKDKSVLYLCPAKNNITSLTTSSAINQFAFSNNVYLKEVKLNSSILQEGAFSYCSALTTVSLPSSIDTINYATFMYCPSLKNINLENIKYIKTSAFACSGLESVNLRDIKEIGPTSFVKNNMESLLIPESCDVIQESAFSNNENLREVIFLSESTSFAHNAFFNTPYANKKE